jgi:CheY-like chemotaxis protein
MIQMSSFDHFIEQVRYALNHLYEPEVLQYSPLLRLLVPEAVQKPSKTLDRILMDAISALKPGLTTPPDAPAWRVYEFLYYRYVQCALQADLARQFSCSIRQIRREQSRALAVLADNLLQQAGLSQADLSNPAEFTRIEKMAQDDNSIKKEYDWLLKSGPQESIEVSGELIALRDVLRPLLNQYRVHLDLVASPSYLLTTMPGAALRQALLSLLTSLIHVTSDKNIRMHCEQGDQDLHIILQTSDLRDGNFTAQKFDERLGDVKSLLLYGHGSLVIKFKNHQLSVDVGLPSVQTVPVLVIDDNRDVLQLLERYTYGTRYRLVACDNPELVVNLIETRHPALITLDVMMNSVDGWQLLRELRDNPLSVQIPIIICSVLKQDELARSLGANDFIHKPVSQEEFLSALDRQYSR